MPMDKACGEKRAVTTAQRFLALNNTITGFVLFNPSVTDVIVCVCVCVGKNEKKGLLLKSPIWCY